MHTNVCTLCSNANSNQIMQCARYIPVNLWQNHKISLKQASTEENAIAEKNVVRNYFSTQPSVLKVTAVWFGLLKIDTNSRNI